MLKLVLYFLSLEMQIGITARQRWPPQLTRSCTPPLRWRAASYKPSSSLFALKICLHHMSFKSFHSGAPPPKKNPGSTPVPRSSIIFSSFASYRSTQGDFQAHRMRAISGQKEKKIAIHNEERFLDVCQRCRPLAISAWNKQPLIMLSLITLQLTQEGVFNPPVQKPTFAKPETTRTFTQASTLS